MAAVVTADLCFYLHYIQQYWKLLSLLSPKTTNDVINSLFVAWGGSQMFCMACRFPVLVAQNVQRTTHYDLKIVDAMGPKGPAVSSNSKYY